jgi:porin
MKRKVPRLKRKSSPMTNKSNTSNTFVRRSIRYLAIAAALITIISLRGSELPAQQPCCDASVCDCLTDTCNSCCDASACDKCDGGGSCGGFDAFGGLCAGDCRCREHLLGDWLGARTCLAEHGIIADLYSNQYFQGVTGGGSEQTFEYGGKNHYEFTFVGEKLGLNKGLNIMMHAEQRYGQDVNVQAGALAFPNTDMLFPFPEKHEAAISGLFLTQAINEKFTLTVGKYRTLDLFNMVYPDANVRGVDGFMNLNLLLPLTLFRTTDLALNGAGILGMKGEQVQSGLLVYDTKNVSTTIAPDLFSQGAVILAYHRFFTEHDSHGFLANWSSKTYAQTDPWSWTVIPGEGLAAGKKSGSWSLAYFGDQTLWADRCDKNRNVRLFSTWGLGDPDTNPYHWTGNVSLQASGLVSGREADTMGIGYFYVGLDSDYKDLVSVGPLPDTQNVQGGEIYYNASITPWMNLTTDFQVVDNQNSADNTAILFGMRAKIVL